MTIRRWPAALALALAGPLALGCSDDDGSAEQLCASVADGTGISVTLQGFDPTDPEAALEQLRPVRVALGDLLGEAPEEVQDDLQVEIDYVQALIDALEGVAPGDTTASALQVQAVTEAHPGVDEAAASLSAFAEREC